MNDLMDIIEADRPAPTTPDVAGLVRAGRRLRRRRRIAVGGIATAAVLAVVVPLGIALGTSGGPDPGDDTTAVEPAADPAPKQLENPQGDECVLTLCAGVVDYEYVEPETFEVLGTPWSLPLSFDSHPVVIYATKGPGVDLRTGGDREVTGIQVGLEMAGGELNRVQSPLMPGNEFDDQPMYNAGFKNKEGHYALVGYVPGEHAEVTWQAEGEAPRPMDGVSTTVLPGYTVYYVSGEQSHDFKLDSTPRGTVSVQGGPSCSDCGTLAGSM